ncbi:ribosome hibernation-promoting factor, HPF/YfiA family [Alicyclobacillus tolerans]|uniref:Ribosome hibernation promoting factor n=2 Tax=Alicyclobacillus tolerans TaxID=90970 RepID=A0A1M6M347_9BACL|nr:MULTISPECIES: ribosome-associated translation inhibitor RaiA [Alicyclobacillus]MDP9728635.1 putative sigma-54 modulation protein [Alicyclobacillus tengchongensis]SHJ77856.1 putative sigma-54 modulation protein [Alicyclobacillus montanus]
MNIQVHGDHMGITPALHDFVDKKLGRLEKYFDAPPEREISVTLSVEKGFHKVEVMLQLHGVLFRAEEKSADMYASIDLVVDKLEQQINRHKSKINQRFRNQGLKTRIQSSTGMDTREESELRVVRTKRFPVKPMDVEEAMMQMDLLGHDFYVFTNAETEEVNVLYRRKSGDYGLIEPQY